MKKIYLAVILGIIAGIIDIIPMILLRLDNYSILSAFFQWVILGFVITHIEFGIQGWLKGLIIAIILALPIIILTIKSDMTAIMPILIMSAILGSFIGFIGNKYGTPE